MAIHIYNHIGTPHYHIHIRMRQRNEPKMHGSMILIMGRI